MLKAQDLIKAPRAERKTAILREAGATDCDAIERARRISGVLNTFLSDYFAAQITTDSQNPRGSILKADNLQAAIAAEMDDFMTTAIEDLKAAVPSQAQLLSSSKNIFEMAGASKLTFANKAVRTLNAKMGLLWERLASLSPYVINPEAEFDIALAGIDLIAQNYDTGLVEFQQLKTQHNTLTGSQRERSVLELSIHANPVFCASFANNSAWTFGHPDIPRVSGADFWSRIGIPYALLWEHVRRLVLAMEDEYVALLEH